MSSRLFRDSVPYRVDHIKSEISGIAFILPTLLILAFWHFRNFRIVSQSKRFGIFLHWIASVTVLLYGSIIPQRDQVVQRNQGETGSRSPLLSLGFISSPNDSYGIVCTMVCIVIPVAIAIIKGKVPNTGVLAFWIAAVVMGVLKIRCFWIAWTVSFVVCAYLCGIGRTGIEREEEGSAIRLMPVLFIGVLLATSVLNASEAARSSDGTTASGWSAFDQETAPIVDALKGTDARIFSNDDTLMNYFEWEDIKVSYDMRPEIWAKTIAGERTHDDYKRYVDVVNAKSFKTLNDGYWDVAIIRKDEQRLFEKEVRGSEKIVSTSRYCLYRLK